MSARCFLRPLAFSILALLACDDNAPTEVPLEDPGSAADIRRVDGGAERDVSAAAITLPVDQSISTLSPAPAFRILQTGTGPNGIFQIGSALNSQTALQALTSGMGRAGFFRNLNPRAALPALQSQTSGSGWAVHALATGRGGAGLFEVTNTATRQSALRATINSTLNNTAAVSGVQSGGTFTHGGVFDLTNPSNGGRAVIGRTNGFGAGGWFETDNTAEHNPTVEIHARGIGRGLEVNARTEGAVIFTESGRTGLQVGEAARPSHSVFNGDVAVNGTLTKSAGSFRIDHPLDPEHKYLSHSFVESPDMMNVYNGNVTLDAAGRAMVELPEYFEALNRDFRYQLTPIGAPGPNLYVAQGVKENRFRIAGGRPYARVSWQVTGVRQDAFANQHRIPVEQDKLE